MDIATKVLGWGVAGALVGGLALFGLQSLLVIPYLDRSENLAAQDKASQVGQLFRSEARAYSRITEDWAYWDDTVRFVAGRHPDFEKENLFPAAFRAIQVDAMVFLRADLSVRWAAEVSPDGKSLVPVAHLASYLAAVRTIGALVPGEGRQGYLALPDGVNLLALRPIQSDTDPGATKGYLIMAHHLDAAYWQSFQSRMGLAVVPGPHESPSATTLPTVTASSDRKRSLIRIPLVDVAGRASLDLLAELPRDLETTGLTLLTQVSAGSIIILLLTTLGNLVFVRGTLIRPVRALWRLTRELEATSNWSLRAPVSSHDEIGQLALGINSLIASVQDKTTQLESLASQDALTGLANRRTFDSALSLAWRVCLRERRPLGFILADVDNFKKFNDRYGHRAGDVCLKTVAQVLQDAAQRPADVKARYGGEEFALILPATDLEGTRLVAERIRAQVESVGLPHDDNGPRVVTISLGCVSWIPEPGSAVETLIEASDRLLYEAKAGGRNRVQTPSS